MTSFSVSIVIPAWNQWEFTQACLDTLLPTIGLRDEVIVVDNGSTDRTAKGLKSYSRVRVITNEENRGFAAACNQGAAAATGDIVVFLNNDTLLPSRWLDGLVAPFAESSVAATGPRSNYVSGPQFVAEANYPLGSTSEMRKFARRWREDHRGNTEEVTRLVGFCLAVRREAFEKINGFDEDFGIGGAEDDDICIRLIQDGGRLLICHESFVHHHGHVTFEGNGVDRMAIQNENIDRFRTKHGFDVQLDEAPRTLLSACMIVKDEADILAECLSSLNNVVDEVVIYDTGSTDGTLELARAAGAKVIEGYWDDDFGRARNAALAECSGRWILQIDADEVFEGDARVLRDSLLNSRANAMQVDILNLSGSGRADLHHRPCRLFRAEYYSWKGRLHEQVVPRDDMDIPVVMAIAPGTRLVHSGYLPEVMESKGKIERNLRMAEVEIEESDGRDLADKLANLGRSYMIADRLEEALATLTQARALTAGTPAIRRTILRCGAQVAIGLGRTEEALQWAIELSAVSDSQAVAKYFKGMALTQLERHREALDALAGLREVKDEDGVAYPMFPVHVHRAQSLAGLDRWNEAAAEISVVLKENASDEPIWGLAVEAYWRAKRSMTELLSAVSRDKINSVFAQIVTVSPEAADAVLEPLYSVDDRRNSVLALAVRIAPRLSVERALEWSSRLREVGMGEDCPLIIIGRSGERTTVDRVTAVGIAAHAFSDERAADLVITVARDALPEDFKDALSTLNDFAPELLGSFLMAAAVDAPRSLVLAQVLHEFGATDEGVAILFHGLEAVGARDVVEEAAAWLETVGRAEEAVAVRSAG